MASTLGVGEPASQPRATTLRFITCGSVDDGKSTLIGRLLYETRAIYADQLEQLEADSQRSGATGQALDFALLVDGLSAEREQGITIDVAYRYFATPARRFIVADTPGHEQYTRNMVTGASTADAAVILIDARKGVLTQTRRHSWLAHLLGVRELVLAVNKMDLVGYDQDVFDNVVADFAAFAQTIGLARFAAIPVSGLTGVNVAERSAATPWYAGPSLLEQLEATPVDAERAVARPFRMPVQWANRPSPDFRGFAGLIASGVVRPGDPVRVTPSGHMGHVARIVSAEGDLLSAQAGQSVTLTLAEDIDCSRGDVIAAADAPPEAADAFSTTLIWMADAPLAPGRSYLLKLATQTVGATVSTPEHVIDVNTQAQRPAETMRLNDIGVADVRTDRPLVFTSYAESADLGGFILIDRASHATVAAGLIRHALRKAADIYWEPAAVTAAARARLIGHGPQVLWFTGLSGAGKTTIANVVEQELHALGWHTFLIDGDNLRHGLNRDLGFTASDRAENVRRAGEVAKLMTEAGLIVLVALISPFRAERDAVRQRLPEGIFNEIFIDTPLQVAEARDVKGLYAKARAGRIPEFTGISSPYEAPLSPEIHIDTTRETAQEAAARIVEHIVGAWSHEL